MGGVPHRGRAAWREPGARAEKKAANGARARLQLVSSPSLSFFLQLSEQYLSEKTDHVGWSAFLVLYPGQHYVCVCVHACFHIVLHDHVFGISGIQTTSLEHTLASLSLFVSYLLVLARLRRESLLPCLGLC